MVNHLGVSNVFGNNWWQKGIKQLIAMVLVVMMSMGLMGCGDRSSPRKASRRSSNEAGPLVGRLSEVAPPNVIQSLRQVMEKYQPQVKILVPKPNEVLNDDRVSVRLQVNDLPLFKDDGLALGPHLHFFLDNQPYQAVYDTNEPLILENLTPGTHTIRVFASRPWHESFKNEGAYAQTTFHVFTKTPDNSPDPNQPLLTYSRPQGAYGGEPIMLDFYLTNAPLHLIAQESPNDTVKDWKIRCTVNGEHFLFDEWQPIYLRGLKPGKNWVQLELLDENGEAIANSFNNTVRLISYEPNGQDTLSKLVRGELSADAARSIVDPNYKPEILEPPTPAPAPSDNLPVPTPTPVPTLPTPEPSPKAEELPAIEPTIQPTEDEPLPVVPDVAPDVAPGIAPETVPPEPEFTPEPIVIPSPQPDIRQPGKFFDRFRRSPGRPSRPSPTPETPTPVLPQPDELPTNLELQEPDAIEPTEPDSTSAPMTAPEQVPVSAPSIEPDVIKPEERPSPPTPSFNPKEFFNRFRPSPAASPEATPLPELLPAAPAQLEDVPVTEESSETEEPSEDHTPSRPAIPSFSPKEFFNRFRPGPAASPEATPLPEPLPAPVQDLPVTEENADVEESAEDHTPSRPAIPSFNPKEFFNRFRPNSATSPGLSPALEPLPAAPIQLENLPPVEENSEDTSPLEDPETNAVIPEGTVPDLVSPSQPPSSRPSFSFPQPPGTTEFFNRFRRRFVTSPSPSPTNAEPMNESPVQGVPVQELPVDASEEAESTSPGTAFPEVAPSE